MSSTLIPHFAAGPGAAGHSDELTTAIAASLAARGSLWRPRTRHLTTGGAARFANRLALETSPYLQQHAHNPVDWHPWGDEAFAKARALGRPILLSIGYSTCHWCHVMEEESFEDEEVAQALNELYIPIKVDREERPDVDAIYMAAVQALTGHGGWPMTVFLTHEREPFYGGTYFPARDGDRGAQTGFLTLVKDLRRVFDQDPVRIKSAASQLIAATRAQLAGPEPGTLGGDEWLHDAFKLYEQMFDDTYGGLARAPKFPSSLPVRLLLRYAKRFHKPRAQAMALKTLRMMADGGLRDHLAGGFHRYSVDERWLVPHFEKMLYDNALLAVAYLEAWQATGDEQLAVVADEILSYAARDMTDPASSAFFSATDADSANPDKGGEREEGWSFTWTPDEIRAALPDSEARAVLAYYAVTPRGNFEGRNIFSTPRPLSVVAAELKIDERELKLTLCRARAILLECRDRRPQPLLDDKILAAWNGLMISAFARVGSALGNDEHVTHAERAMEFVLKSLVVDGRLQRSFKDGAARHAAYLEDYAFVIAALLDLFEATGKGRYLKKAAHFTAVTTQLFEDQERGGFFMTAADHETLLVREKPAYDGATPSGNSVMTQNLLRLDELLPGQDYRARAEKALKAFAPILKRSPTAMSEMLLAFDFYRDAPRQIVLSARTVDELAPFRAELNKIFLPNRVVVALTEASARELEGLTPLAQDRAPTRQPSAYVCIGTVCKLPSSDPFAFATQLTESAT